MNIKKYFLTNVLFFLLFIIGTENTFAQELKHDPILRKEIGQMLMVGFDDTVINDDSSIVKAIMQEQIGGVILFDRNTITHSPIQNILNPEQLRKLTERLQYYARKAAFIHRHRFIPLIIAIDYEGGAVNRLKEKYGFPKTESAQAVAEKSPQDARKIADAMAVVLKQEGINMNFAPVVDVNVNPKSPIIGAIGRSFSSNPNRVVRYAAIFAQAYHDKDILCAYKHFPGHGSAMGDTHLGFVDVSETWKKSELIPYQRLLHRKNACTMVVVAHVVNKRLDPQGYPASLSQRIIEHCLRQKLHFNGVVVSDDLEMDAIKKYYDEARVVRLAINAGEDLLVFRSASPAHLIDLIEQQVQEGHILKQRIEAAYRRILRMKRQI